MTMRLRSVSLRMVKGVNRWIGMRYANQKWQFAILSVDNLILATRFEPIEHGDGSYEQEKSGKLVDWALILFV